MSTNISAIDRGKIWAGSAIVAVLVTTGLLLRGEGRLWICACGKLSIWAGQVCSASNSQQFLDPFSFTHVLHGFVYAWLLSLLTMKAPRLATGGPFSPGV